jgi:hypothetical protein
MSLTKVSYSLINGSPLNVLDYGADPTGTSDSSAAVQAAINYAQSTSTGRAIFFPAGTYLCNVIDNGTKGVHFFGEGRLSTTIVSNQNNEFAIKIDRNFRNTLIEHMTISGLDKTRHGVYVNTGAEVDFNDVQITQSGLGVCSNSTIEVTFNCCEFRFSYVGVYLTTRRTSGSLTVPNVNGQTVTLTDAFFPQHPTCTYFNECLITLNTIGFVIDQGDNPLQKDALISVRNTIVENNKMGLVFRDSVAFAQGHVPYSENVWFELNQSVADIIFNGVTYLAANCGDVYQVGGLTVWKSTTFVYWYSESKAQTIWNDCGVQSELATVKTADTSSIICDLLYGENANLASANLQTNALVTTSGRSLIAKTQAPTNFCRHIGTQRSNKFFAADANDTFGSSATNVIDGVFETNECKEYTATVGNGVIVSSGDREPNNYWLCIFSARRISGDTLFRVFPLGANSVMQPNKIFTLTDDWQTFVMAVAPNSFGTGGSGVVFGPHVSSGVFRVSGAFTIKFSTTAEMIEFQRRGKFPVL